MFVHEMYNHLASEELMSFYFSRCLLTYVVGEGEHLSFPSPNDKRALEKEEKEKNKTKRKPGLSNGETSNCSTNRRN